MIFVKLTVLLTILIATSHSKEDDSNNLLSNNIDETSAKSWQPKASQSDVVDGQSSLPLLDAASNHSQKNRRSRYLRQLPPPLSPYRSRRRPQPPPYDMPRRVPPSRNRFKPERPYPPPKSRYRYHREQWPLKWTDQRNPPSPYGPPYSFDDDDDVAEPEPSSPYDDYDDNDDDYKMEDDPYSSKRYRGGGGYEDVMPLSSIRYNEKRKPNFEYPRSARIRGTGPVAYDEYDTWPDRLERPRFAKPYRDYADIVRSKKLADMDDVYTSGGGGSMTANHRFKFSPHPSTRFKNYYDADGYDFSTLNTLKRRRFQNELANLVRIAKPYPEETRYENVVGAKYNAAPSKTVDSADVVYSAKYRGNGDTKESTQKVEQDEKTDADQSAGTSLNDNDWKRYQPMYQQPADTDKMKYGRDVIDVKNQQSYKNQQQRLLPNELIAYMSADPSEPVIGKEQRYLETSYPYDVLKSTLLRKMSPIIDHEMEVVFEGRMNDWKR